MSTSATQRPSRDQRAASQMTETVPTIRTPAPASGTSTIFAASTIIALASGASTIPAASSTTAPTGNFNMLQLATTIISAGWPPQLVKKHTYVTDAFATSWNLGDPKELGAFVRASEPDDGWKRFNVGTTTATKLLDLVQDKASLFNWDMILRAPIDGTGQIAVNPNIIRNGSKTIDASFIDFLNLSINYTWFTMKNCQNFASWYNGGGAVKLTDAWYPDHTKRLIEIIDPNDADENISLVNQYKVHLCLGSFG